MPSTSSSPGVSRLRPASPFTEAVGGEPLGRLGVVVDEAAENPPPEVDAKAYVVADLDTGAVLAAKNAHQQLRPASTLKTLTALTLLPRLDKRARYKAVQADADVEGSKVGIEANRVYTIDQLFYGLFLPSGNDAALALAKASGGMKVATGLMNEEAKRLGAYDTHAVNTSGLDEPGQLSSAYDLALVARAGLANADFRRYAATPRYDFPGRGGKTFQIQNGNDLLREYPGAIGVKNGYTSKAHNTLVGAAERDGHRIVVTLLRTDAPLWETAAELLDWGFASLETVEPVGSLVTPKQVAKAVAAKEAVAHTPKAGPGTSPPQLPESPEPDSAAPIGAAPSVAPTSLFVPQGLLNLPAWIWLCGGVFVVLASLRVFSHFRARRRADRAQPF
jgi:serine-type D-Ala-D-Ala carboxypeptidase (penicillin-binding protein 5/6)